MSEAVNVTETAERKERNFIENEIDKDLAEGRYTHVQTRFPPEPNGYLHIGHAKSILLNSGLAEEYGGKFNLRYDDTNPTKEKLEFVESIRADVEWLGADFEDRVFFASDYFDTMYECALKLIRNGKAFVCDLTADQIREYRGDFNTPGKESPYRNRTVEENLKLFTEMKEGIYPDGSRVLRAKIDMASPNINMRDPVIYRIAHMPHHNTGDKWCIRETSGAFIRCTILPIPSRTQWSTSHTPSAPWSLRTTARSMTGSSGSAVLKSPRDRSNLRSCISLT